MVGIPRSTGCRMCLQRRIKCDAQRPACLRCMKKGVQCPGYAKPAKFVDERPSLEQRYTTPTQSSSTASIDEQVLPSLMSKSMARQQPIVFSDFIYAAFPRFFGLNKYRANVPWIDFVAENLGKNAAFDKSVFCMTSAFMGGAHHDNQLQRSSREMYGKALASFQRLTRNERSLKAIETLSACMLLCMFETYSQTSPNSWVQHAAGASLLMSLRGPDAHRSGFGRCLYLSFRSFVVAHSFLLMTPCIFEKPGWQALIDQVRAEDMVDPRVNSTLAAIIDLSDKIFLQIVRIPRLMKEASQFLSSPSQWHARDVNSLKARVFDCRDLICFLTAQLQLAVAVQEYQTPEHKEQLIRPVPLNFPRSFADSLFQGTNIGSKILGLLLTSLSSHQYQSTFGSDSRLGLQNIGGHGRIPRGLPFRIISRVCASNDTDGSGSHSTGRSGPIERWLDQVASSMGLGAFEIIMDGTVT
ncbi:hypothetical protein P175DRAFT_0530832 [Aspergillus ochraceoroseus IBT 24754]|uniref:Zn(2)-C6 fungal-type domain-containing protein n=2 Tax=Aspergillus ochraceoroseus TaxID=138278 RepID=A0A2T5LYH7_9EURO|nr:uncharacterized protein P175DRAFT_0530832 [Aspergillus ochraceoroseus IBT 24754]KKK14562.1 hypothetical protein AOCH_001974 [Aspergillus ochraceoroseus]PTU21338.1 hypothetical protein P175DRAFT_0530832 [Aspergillus ochraceoroseus IBT 24754]